MLAEREDDRLVLDRKHCRLRVLRPRLQISDGIALFPLGDGLGIDAVSPGKPPQALLTMLYRSTDRLCRCGAAVKNLSHSASLKSPDKGAPSNPGIKQLGIIRAVRSPPSRIPLSRLSRNCPPGRKSNLRQLPSIAPALAMHTAPQPAGRPKAARWSGSRRRGSPAGAARSFSHLLDNLVTVPGDRHDHLCSRLSTTRLCGLRGGAHLAGDGDEYPARV